MLEVNVHKRFKSKRRSLELSYEFAVENGQTTAIYGTSGVGKSTVLRMIAGLSAPDGGRVAFNSAVWYSSDTKQNLKPKDRNVGFVFQEFNLFPNMTVQKNLKYASDNGEIPSHILQLMELAGLKELMHSYPDELSGGQKQRIAILRSLCQNPDLLLLDEPFSALDDETIVVLIEEIKRIQEKLDTTIVVVSHRKDVIFRMADHVIHLKENNTLTEGKPEEVLEPTF